MDPSKSFDHLDPKLKETYARVMGTNTNGDSSTPAQSTPAPAAPSQAPGGLSASPYSPAGATQQPAFDPSQNQFGATPSPTLSPNTGPNPGTGPTISAMPVDMQASYTPPATEPPSQAAQEQASPPNNAFFASPAPAADPASMTEQADQNAADLNQDATPITPYSPEDYGTTQATSPDQMAQPLPSPASVNQSAPHETSALLKVLYIVGSVIFFAVYTLFWIKIFGLPLPFPLPF